MHADKLDTDIHSFLERHQNKDLLRFVTVGSVDDGKSTLIGRILYDTGAVYLDHLEDARSGQASGGEIDLARITDGLIAEREQGITIDVAYRYFTTAKRKFIIADTPGHIQYTRNMATGASTAELGIILIDAKLGVLQQSRRHAYIASLLGIPNLVVAINKMDLVDYSQDSYEAIKKDFQGFSERLHFQNIYFLPVSALAGDNVVTKSERMPWFTGPTLLEHLETIDLSSERSSEDFRFPVQYALRPDRNYRGFAGQIVSGAIQKGERVKVMPAGTTSTIKAIDVFEGEIDRAFAPMSVTLRLEDEIDISRGDIIVPEKSSMLPASNLETMVVWMSETPLDRDKAYLIKHGTRYLRASIPSIHWKMDLENLEEVEAETLNLNDIAKISLNAHRPIVFDPYTENRRTGAFIVIDSLTNFTVAAGMMLRSSEISTLKSQEGSSSSHSGVSAHERAQRLGHAPAVIALSAENHQKCLNAAYELERRIFDRGVSVHVYDSSDTAVASASAIASVCSRAGVVTILACGNSEVEAVEEILSSIDCTETFHIALSDSELKVEEGVKSVLLELEKRRILS